MDDTKPPTSLDSVADALLAYARLEDQIREWSQMRDVLRAQIQHALGDAEAGTVAGRPVVRWSRYVERRLSTTAVVKKFTEADLADCYRETERRRFTLVKP